MKDVINMKRNIFVCVKAEEEERTFHRYVIELKRCCKIRISRPDTDLHFFILC